MPIVLEWIELEEGNLFQVERIECITSRFWDHKRYLVYLRDFRYVETMVWVEAVVAWEMLYYVGDGCAVDMMINSHAHGEYEIIPLCNSIWLVEVYTRDIEECIR